MPVGSMEFSASTASKREIEINISIVSKDIGRLVRYRVASMVALCMRLVTASSFGGVMFIVAAIVRRRSVWRR